MAGQPTRLAGHTPREHRMFKAYATLLTLVSFAEDRLKREEKGATAVEYGLLVGLIAVAIVATLLLLGPKLDSLFLKVKSALPTT
jgi:pilus assembly protein Flp/PilA